MGKKYKYKFWHSWDESTIVGFAILVLLFTMMLLAIVGLTIRDTIIKTECIRAGGNMEFGECRLPQQD